MNTGDPWPGLDEAEYRVLVMQKKRTRGEPDAVEVESPVLCPVDDYVEDRLRLL